MRALDRYCRKLWVCHRAQVCTRVGGDRGTKAAPDERIGAAPTGCFDIELGVAVESRAGWIAQLTAVIDVLSTIAPPGRSRLPCPFEKSLRICKMREHEADVNQRGFVRWPGMEYVRVCRSLAQRLLRASTSLLSSKSMPTTRPLVPPPAPTRCLHSARAAGVDHSGTRKRLEPIEQRLR